MKRYFSQGLHKEWAKLVKAELKGKEPSSLMWNTPEVQTLLIKGNSSQASVHKGRCRSK